VDAQAKCTANLAAQCMGDCTSNFTLQCVQSGDGDDAGVTPEASLPPLPPPSPAHPRLRPLSGRGQ
jgi:hypothetical protein